MSKCKTNLGCKAIAWILCILSGAVCFLTLPQVNTLACQGAYQPNRQLSDILAVEQHNILLDDANIVLEYYESSAIRHNTVPDQAEWVEDENISFLIHDKDRKTLLEQGDTKNYRDKVAVSTGRSDTAYTETQWAEFATEADRKAYVQALREEYDTVTASYETYEDENGDLVYYVEAQCTSTDQTNEVTITTYLAKELEPATSSGYLLNQVSTQYMAKDVLLIVCLSCAALCLVTLVWLCWSAGCQKEEDGPRLWILDRILPIEIILLLACLLLALGLETAVDGSQVCYYSVPWYVIVAQAGTMAGVLVLFLSLVRQVKAKVLWERSLIHRLGRPLCRAGGKLGQGCKALVKKVPLFWQALVLFLVFCFLEGLTVVMVTQWVRTGPILWGVFLWGLLKVLEAAGVIYVVLSLRALQNGGKELAAGNLDHQIPLEKLRGPFRDHGETLNNIRSAIQTAVEEQMTAERMKTELITNVSHDIKTPLTSIVSYVDLLKKEDLPQGKAQDYLEVLDRQSAKLKKLIEDLVEASKASTGAMEVHCQRTDVNVLLSQSAGEYGEKLAGRDLTLVMTQAEDNPAISADGRLLWRVLDNLLSNIVKYALAGTRVYVTSADTAEEVTLTFRNISQEPLNISAGELTQRFVRGDASRSTEGSGLGLSIAQSLTQLQNGTFQVDIDGDLFKVTLTFPRL